MLKTDHIAILVADIDEALTFWRDALGLKLEHVEEVASQEVKVAFLPLGGHAIELVQPMGETSSLASYLAKRGPGLHHLCFEVDDVEAALTRLKEQGVRLINKQPVEGAGGKKVAFIHPKSASGVLVELSQPADG
jgi:methylmalonyl-CoA/ethylmalonyl-CoA epimerase